MINTASGVIDSWVHPDFAGATYDHDKNVTTPEVAWPDVYKRYASSTRRIDSAVGDIIQLLKDLKIDDNTLIVFTSDNGPSRESYLTEDYEPDFFNGFGPFDGIKRDVLEGGIRVSALAYWPGHIPAGRLVKTPSSSYNWLPTFAQLAGVPAPAVADGVSLVPSLTGSGKQRKSLVYVEYFEGGKTPDYGEFIPDHQGKIRKQMQMVRMNKYVGIRYNINSHSDNFELFNVIKDPKQANNLSRNPGMETVQQLMEDKVLQSRRPNNSAKRPYDDELVPALSHIKTIGGVEWKAYKGDFLWVPDVAALKPSETGTANRPDTDVNKETETQTLYFTGYIRIPADGEYTFFLNTNHGAFLRIHDAAVIDADFAYAGGTERRGSIRLKSGLHPYRLYYTSKGGARSLLDFQWSGPAINKQSVPPSVFLRNAKI